MSEKEKSLIESPGISMFDKRPAVFVELDEVTIKRNSNKNKEYVEGYMRECTSSTNDGGDNSTDYQFLEDLNLKIRRKVVDNNKGKVIDLNDFKR